MGKKGKKKGSGGGKKKGKKGKKGGKKKEPQMTFKEALLAYQINIKEKQIEDYKYEIRGLEERNKRHKERNDRLESEQVYYIRNLLKQAKEFEKQLSEAEVVNKEQVIAIMMDKWATEKNEIKSIENLKEELKEMDVQIAKLQSEVTYWADYKDRGCYDHKKQIKLLENELEDMQNAFEEMTAHINRNLDKAKDEIRQSMDETLDNQKFIASEKAMGRMDKNSKQEVLDNDWLKRETVIHKREYDELLSNVENLEKRNLEIMSELFDCKIDDLKISRNFYLTQFEENDDLDASPGILELDLARVSLDSKPMSIEAARPVRPKSATQRAVEKKVFSLITAPQEESESEEESGSDEDESGSEATSVTGSQDPFDNYFNFDDEDFNDYLQLGPLELKMLSIQGQQMKIFNPLRPPTAETNMQACNPEKWPVTHPMLKHTLNPPPPRETLY
ncbi:coiled-coil domain-containing protein 83-like [Lineus longissimus]|uniref:coiled-coil domain-containing protein 83-like n=1 Tax=Lineus longissimus TaxID=88925 RepID=UPI002B4E9767